MDSYLEFTGGLLRRATDLHIEELILEVDLEDQIGPMTRTYVDDVLQRMVAHGSTPDVLIHGVKEAHEKVQKEILREGARRWKLILNKMRE